MTHGASIYKASAPCRHIVITLCYCKYVFLLGLHKFTYVLKLSRDGKPLGTMLVFSITIGHNFHSCLIEWKWPCACGRVRQGTLGEEESWN